MRLVVRITVLIVLISIFECHSILQTLSYNKYIDEVQHGVECMLSRITFYSRNESTIVNSKKFQMLYYGFTL